MVENAKQPLSFRTLSRFVHKMRIKSGDIIILEHKSGLTNTQTIDSILQVCDEMGLKNIAVLVVDDVNELRIINEKEMNKHGWFHIDALSKMIHKDDKKGENNDETTEQKD